MSGALEQVREAGPRRFRPYPAYKDSGVEWLGQIPAHWDVGALARWWQVIDCKHRTAPFLDDGFAVASIGEVQGLVAVPLAGEQHHIASFCSRIHESIQRLIDEIRRVIAHLSEFQTALISAAITGKIDVREEAR